MKTPMSFAATAALLLGTGIATAADPPPRVGLASDGTVSVPALQEIGRAHV